MEWFGHVIRMNEIRSVKKVFEGKLEGRRGIGRPRLRWINDLEENLRQLGVKRWRMKALDREEWASITRVGTLIVATIYLQLIQNRYMFRSFTVLQCSHQHCVQPVASDV